MSKFLIGMLVLSCPFAFALPQVPPSPGPQVTILLKDRAGRAVPIRQGFTHTGGGNIDVAQPAPDAFVATMSAVAVAGAHPLRNSNAAMTFELDQCFDVVIENPKVKRVKLSLEGRVIGLLRTHRGGGTAEQGPAHAVISRGGAGPLAIALPSHCVTGGDNLSVNDRQGPLSTSAAAGEHHFHQSFAIAANFCGVVTFCKAASSEFAPDPALDPLWISHWEPFHGAIKKDFGFQVTVRVAADLDAP